MWRSGKILPLLLISIGGNMSTDNKRLWIYSFIIPIVLGQVGAMMSTLVPFWLSFIFMTIGVLLCASVAIPIIFRKLGLEE